MLGQRTGRKCLGKEPGKTLGQDNRAQSLGRRSGKTSLQPADADSRAMIGRKFHAKRPMQKRVLNIGPNHSQGLMIAKFIIPRCDAMQKRPRQKPAQRRRKGEYQKSRRWLVDDVCSFVKKWKDCRFNTTNLSLERIIEPARFSVWNQLHVFNGGPRPFNIIILTWRENYVKGIQRKSRGKPGENDEKKLKSLVFLLTY